MHKQTPRIGATLLLLVLVVTACAGYGEQSATMPAMFKDGVLVDRNGMTLYTFDKDPRGAGTSACNGPCARNWPPLLAGPDAVATGKFSIIRRDDGSRQWAYAGKPLYLWIKDREPGDRTGDNFRNVWHVIEQDTMTSPSRRSY